MSFEAPIPAKDIINATQRGTLDLEAAERMFAKIAEIAKDKADYEILIDTREATPKLSITELWLLVSHLASYGKVFARKTAVLAAKGDWDKVSFFELCANNRGFLVHAFTDYDEAMSWLFRPAGMKAAVGSS